MSNETTHITIYRCPKEIQEAARLWKPILGTTINAILIEMLRQGAEKMQGEVLKTAQEKLKPIQL